MAFRFGAIVRRLFRLDRKLLPREVSLEPFRSEYVPALTTWGAPKPLVLAATLAEDTGGVAVCIFARGQLVGLAYVVRDEEAVGVVAKEVGVIVSKQHQRKGVGLHAMRALIEHCRQAGFRRLRAKARVGSGGAALARKSGMKPVHVEENDEFFELQLSADG